MLNNLTDQERQEMKIKAQEARQAKREFAEKNLKIDWEDDSYWIDLAKKHQYKLPQRFDKAGSKWVNRFLKAKGLDIEWYRDHTGIANGNKEALMNPAMTARAQVGLLLEAYDEDFGDNT